MQYGSSSVKCNPDPAAASFSDPSTPIEADLTGLATGSVYHYRIVAGNANGSNFGIDRTVTPAAVLGLRTLAAEGVDEHGATLAGSFDQDNLDTAYHFEYGLDSQYGQSTPDSQIGAALGTKAVSTAIDSLPSGRTFHYRIVATNSLGTTYGEDRTFRSASPPQVSGVRATDVTETSAILHARIDPVGYQTSYHFEYGTTSAYGTSIPIDPADLGSVASQQAIAQQISGLQPGFTYHFRVVASNEWGATESADTTLDFFPPKCPNEHVRQQSRTSYLPDCRAYELVSPADAGSVLLFPGEEFARFHETFPDVPLLWPLNHGLARSPSRFSFLGGAGAVSGLDPTNGAFDPYVATRTNSGWVTTLPGLSGHQSIFSGEMQCSENLGRCLDHNFGDPLAVSDPGATQAPYLFTAEGKALGQLPTSVDLIPGGTDFLGDQRLSGDGGHFAFSSNGIRFAPDGIKGSPGSAYDNDIDDRAVTTISKLAGGAPIPQEFKLATNQDETIKFPGISSDGSHVLMQVGSSEGGAQPADGLSHLYMRVDDAVTYDVSRGHGVNFVGMSADGTKVYFLAKAAIGDGDADNSVDLYMWNEAGGADTLTRVSQGNGQGNADDCKAAWATRCDVAALSTELAHPFGLVNATGVDDLVARDSGDVYFYSPEVLDSNDPGIASQRNLYVYRDGAVQLVATLDPGTEIDRIQIAPDGAHAAFLTAAQLTGYDNEGFREMYVYDAGRGIIRCVSCRPDGLAPTGDVQASQGGPFMANDGRAFFSSPDSLVPQDSNEGILDVYEYVDGRPQLISSGTGSRDFTGGGTAFSLFAGVHTGLEAVSGDGTDVYFSTYDVLVPQDENGPYVKFYDARTSGGFDLETEIGSCAAADECHGPAGASSPGPGIATEGALGNGGNMTTVTRRPKRQRKAKRHRARAHRAAHVRTGHRNG